MSNIETMAYNLLPLSVIAANLEVSELDFRMWMDDHNSDAFRAYMKGFGKQLFETHAAIIKAAANGSNPAQMEVVKMIEQCMREIMV